MKKILIMFLCALMIITTGCTNSDSDDVQEYTDIQTAFDALQEEWFIEDISSDFTDMHFALADESTLGITDVEVSLGTIEADYDDTTYADRIKQLEEINVEDLTEDQQVTYNTMLWYFELMQDMTAFEYEYGFLFTPNGGVNNNLITIFTEYYIFDESDVQEFIVLLNDTDRYIQECIDFTLEQAEEGIIQTDSVIDSIIEQIERFTEKVDDNEIIAYFDSATEDLDIANIDEYRQQVVTAVTEVVIPAYQKIIVMYEELYGQSTTSGLLCEYEYGKEYYELIVRRYASTNMDVDDLIEYMEEAVYDAFIELYYGLEYSETETTDYGVYTAEDILNYLQTAMADDYPDIPVTEFSVAYLDTSVVSDNVVAYYVTAPYDMLTRNVIKVNPLYVSDSDPDLCIYLAHEGYPGHLYAHTYYFSNHSDQIYRYAMSFIGTSEGWANYAMTHAYSYFVDDEVELCYLQGYEKFSYELMAYIDLQMHYNGWTVDDITDYLSNYYQEYYASQIAESLYETNIGDPGTYLSYGVGLALMWDLCSTAMNSKSNSLTRKEFNTLVLEAGETSFDVLEELVNNAIGN